MPATITSTADMPLQMAAPAISSIDIPFLINFSAPEFDKIVIFIVTVLLAITVNAEGQAFAATVLGDIKQDAKDRFHFNPFLHINLAGLLCFAAAGFGWSKQISIDKDKFKHPEVAIFIVKFVGAFSNLLLASIAGSILFVMKKWNLEDQVFTIVIAVNITVFVYNCIPVPPLAGASFVYAVISLFFPKSRISSQQISNNSHINENNQFNITSNKKAHSNFEQVQTLFLKVVPYIFAALLVVMKINGWTFISEKLDPVVRYIFQFLAG